MIARPTRSGRKVRLSVLTATAAAMVLSGCGSVHPGSAAVVGSTTISPETVDGLAEALCTANVKGAEAAGQPQEFTSRSTREAALQVLLDTQLSQQLGKSKGIEPQRQMVSQALAQNQDLITSLPADQRDAYSEALKEYAEGQIMVIDAGRRSLEDQGKTGVTDDQALAEGKRLRSEFAKTIDVEVDPRYGSFENETLQSGGAALSVAQSEQARSGQPAKPGNAFVAGLPTSQKCS